MEPGAGAVDDAGPTSRYFAGRRLVQRSAGSTTWASRSTIRGDLCHRLVGRRAGDPRCWVSGGHLSGTSAGIYDIRSVPPRPDRAAGSGRSTRPVRPPSLHWQEPAGDGRPTPPPDREAPPMARRTPDHPTATGWGRRSSGSNDTAASPAGGRSARGAQRHDRGHVLRCPLRDRPGERRRHLAGLVITGVDDVFIPGGDLGGPRGRLGRPRAARHGQRAVRRRPMVAETRGLRDQRHRQGGGLIIAMLSDVAVASDRASFRAPSCCVASPTPGTPPSSPPRSARRAPATCCSPAHGRRDRGGRVGPGDAGGGARRIARGRPRRGRPGRPQAPEPARAVKRDINEGYARSTA